MGKASRLRRERDEAKAQAQAEPKIIGTIKINILEGGGVNVEGPIANIPFMLESYGKGLMAFAQFIKDQTEGKVDIPRILTPGPGLIVP